MAWSIFQQPSGDIKAEGFAAALLQSLGVKNASNQQVQFVYDWELAEGGGGRNNPLNVGPIKGLALTGSQYGGGAADYGSLHTGMLATVDYLHMPNYRALTRDLIGNNIQAAETDLFKSPWAHSHYGYGKDFPNTKLPIPIKGGVENPPHYHVTLGGIIQHLPGATVRTAGDIGSGAGSVASGAGNVAGSFFGGLFKSPIAIIVVVVLVVVLLKR